MMRRQSDLDAISRCLDAGTASLFAVVRQQAVEIAQLQQAALELDDRVSALGKALQRAGKTRRKGKL